MKAVHAYKVARKGSDVTLKCRGGEVSKFDTEVQWKFNGKIITEDSNKKAEIKYRMSTEKRKGLFSLHITNVSQKDVGRYACKATVRDFGLVDEDEDFIELSLYTKGEFHLIMSL